MSAARDDHDQVLVVADLSVRLSAHIRGGDENAKLSVP